jgi:hypothetical protein
LGEAKSGKLFRIDLRDVDAEGVSIMPDIGTLPGACSCGAVRYEITASPLLMLNCHCRACQQASGSAYAAIVVIPRSGFHVQGELRYHRRIGGSGQGVERGFCPKCGSQVVMILERMPEAIGVQAGSLSDPAHYRPSMDVFTASAQPRDHIPAEARRFEYGFAS